MRHLRFRIAGALLLAAILAAAGVSLAETPAELCDRLAAEPGTVEGLTGVDLSEIDAEAAIAACAKALEEAPGDPHLAHQYARALERAGRLEEAKQLYGWAAEDGYAPAVAALERLASAAPADALVLPADAAAKAEMLAGLVAVLNRYEASLPPDPADPLTILADVGGEPQALLAWVSENTQLVPYRGELRGAVGVLIDRSGNSLDRALLLAEFLRLGGHEVRLARAALSTEQALALLPATLRTVAVPALPPLTAEQTAAFFEAEPRLDRAQVRAAAAAAESERTEARALFDQRLALVLPAVRDAVLPLAAAANSAAEAEMRATLADHFWVQLRVGTGWTDLDPEAGILGTLGASETFAPDALPAELRHSVVLRVVLELQDSQGRREERLLEWEGFTAELVDRPLQLSHVPRKLSAVDIAWLIAQPDARERLLALLDEETGWMPLLAIGDQVLADRLFTRDGQIAAANANALTEAGTSLGALFDEADTLLGGEAAAPPEPAVPTAEWLEVEVRVPGQAPLVDRRTIFDLVGPATRMAGTPATFTDLQIRERALRLLGQTQILLLGAAPSELQVEHIQVRELRAVAERLSTLLGAGTIDPDAISATEPPAPLILLSFARERMTAPLGRPRAAGSPTVVLQHQRLALAADQTVTAQLELDIVRNEVAAARDPFDTRLAQGVADTVLEGLALDEQLGLRNAAARHVADLSIDRTWTLVDPSDLSRFDAAGVAADDRARLEADVAAGYIVIAPALPEATAPGDLAWWRVDPRNGSTLGMLASGGGAAFGEYTWIVNVTVGTSCAGFAMLGIIIGTQGPAAGVAAGVGFAVCAAWGPVGFVYSLPGALFGSGVGIAGAAVLVLNGNF